MKVKVNYEKEVKSCKECPYYHEEKHMGGSILMCCANGNIIFLSDENVIHPKCPKISD